MNVLPADAIGSVRSLIAAGKSKLALDRAKEVHKQLASPDSEAALIDAYLARISALVDTRMPVEAHALAQLVRQKFPAAATRLEAVDGRAGLLEGNLACLKPLADPALDPARRDALHALIRRDLLLPAQLARFDGLPDGHALRVAAQAIDAAFTAVTSGPVSEEQLQLREVSHRSPLAPWKILIQAIGALYRRDDDACRRLLDTLDPVSAAARLKLPIEAMLSGQLPPDAPAAAAMLLAERTGGGMESLRGALRAADEALRNPRHTTSFGQATVAAREAMKAARRYAPKLATALEEQLAARLFAMGLSEEEALSQLGASKTSSANRLRLWALAQEHGAKPDELGALMDWAAYRQMAVNANLFPESGPVSSAVFMHMAGLLGRADPQMLRELLRRTSFDRSPRWMFDRRELYQRAAAADPCTAVYRQWLAWEKTRGPGGSGGKFAELAAEAWRRALPKDLEPLLYLADVLEERNALQKALGNIAKAEAIDGLNADVRRARSRLLFRAACRGLKNAKPGVVEKHIAALTESAFASQGEMPGLAWSIRYCLETLEVNQEQSREALRQVRALVGNGGAAALIWNVAIASQVPLGCQDLLSAVPANERMEASARICLLGDRLGVAFYIPHPWSGDIAAALRQGSAAALDSAALLSLGEAALRRQNHSLAYVLSTAGLAAGGVTEGRFLLLRARSLPQSEDERRNQCLAAVVTLARRQRDNALVSAAIEARRGADRYYDDELASTSDFTVTDEHLAALLAGERAAAEYSATGRNTPSYVARFLQLCMCPACQAERASLDADGGLNEFDADPFETDEDEDLGDFESDFGSGPAPSMPPELARVLNTMPPEDAYKMLTELAKLAGVAPPPRSLFPGLGGASGGAGKTKKRRGRSR
ncbi:MAG: hypothetical protein IT162_03510 [Bryobacterales bacterium]|nr:hypothetical protein [Bryobacterales bacterium]